MRRLFIVALMLLTLGCAVPTEDSAQVIDQEELPDALRNSTTTTTTTLPASTATEPFEYYVLQSRAEQETRFVVAVSRPVGVGATTAEKLEPLFGDDFVTSEEDEEGLFNQISVFDLLAIDDANESGVATVKLEIESETEVERGALADVAAQLVWTLTELDGIEAILIEINGELTQLPTDDEGDVSESVTRENYRTYERDFVPPETVEEPSDDG